MQLQYRITCALATLTTLLAGTASQARLGEEISKYKEKVAKVYTSKSQSSKDGKTSYLFSINMDPQIKKVAPDFGGSLNISVDPAGKIVGQTMALRLGKNVDIGKTIAVRYFVDFSYESLGRTVPKNTKEVGNEVVSYTTAINKAMMGDPQNITYPKIKGKIVATKLSDDTIAFAATP
jgi:hypothetical protein